MTDKDMEEKDSEVSTLINVGVASANIDAVGRFGSASAEYVKSYTGVDNEMGKMLDKGLKGISTSKVHPDYAEQNIRQQAGFSAEVHKVASTNAENIIQGNPRRLSRTDDQPQLFGKNHPVYDHVEIDADGVVIPGSGSQMKFVTDYENLLKKIAQGRDGKSNDLSRYLDPQLDLPSEQVEKAREFCTEQARKMRRQAERLEAIGKGELAARKRVAAENYEKLRSNIRDSGMTTDQAIFYRKHPVCGTAIDIATTGHRAGLTGAGYGAAIGGVISIVTNGIALYQGNKESEKALLDTIAGTSKAAAVGYGTAFVGATAKGIMQQSSSAAVRTLSRTSLPALAVSVCLEMGSAVTRYTRGEINGTEFLEVVGEKGSGMLAGGLGAMLGQIGIPIPIVGGLVGGMVGYMLSSMFYRDSLAAFQEADAAREDYLRIKAFCEEARANMEAYRLQFRACFSEWLQDRRAELTDCISRMDEAVETGQLDEFVSAANALAACMGTALQFATREEFDGFMTTDEILIL